MEKECVTVVIPSYNRFNYLINAVKSIKNQTYKNIEIIVVNDCSTDKIYYDYEHGEYSHIFNNVRMIHLKNNTRTVFGYPCAAYVRTIGCKFARGKYIAFLDDDDIWLSKKIELQMNAMKKYNCKMSCTEGLIGEGVYNKNENYKKYNEEHYYDLLCEIYNRNNYNYKRNRIPCIFNKLFLTFHNCCVCSSVIIAKDVLEKIGYFKTMKPPGEDYNCWLNVIEHTDCAYVNETCFYYDLKHGNGSSWHEIYY